MTTVQACAAFRFKFWPLRPTIVPMVYFPQATQEGVLNRLDEALANGEALLLLLGDSGLGKSLLARRFLEKHAANWAVACVGTCQSPSVSGLLQAVLFDLGVDCVAKTEQELRLLLTERLLAEHQAGKRLLLVIDDAHHLGARQLEELRLLGNLEAPSGKLLYCLLAGLPRLATTLHAAELRSLKQLCATRCLLEPWSGEDGIAYLHHALEAAGGAPQHLLHDEALGLLVQISQGVPRLLGQLASRALLLAAANGQRTLDVEAILEAAHDLGLEIADSDDLESLEAQTANPSSPMLRECA